VENADCNTVIKKCCFQDIVETRGKSYDDVNVWRDMSNI
jgi:hypothetical protein